MTTPTTPESVPIGNVVASYIRTFVGLGVGALVTWLFRRWNIVLDDSSTQAATIGATAIVSGVYYAIVRLLESKWKGFGWFLGLATKPKYAPVAAPANAPAK
jgi:hypothetical protein